MNDRIEIRLACAPIPDDTAALYAGLLEELVRIVGPGAVESLNYVVIVDPSDVADTVNRLIAATGELRRYVSSPTHPAQAVTVPLESAGAFSCVIVLARTFLEPLGPTFRRPWDTVSTTLEELLHVWLFDAAFRRRGYVQPRTSDFSACDADLLTVAARISDEYVVTRRKARILGSTSLVQGAPGGDLVTCQVRYGGSLVAEMASGSERLESLLQDGREMSTLLAGYWPSLADLLWRGIFEPLSRHAAYVDAGCSEPAAEQQLLEQRFYRAALDRYWRSMRAALQRLFESNLLETEAVTAEILGVLRDLLADLGVVYRNLPDGGCWVEVRPI